MSSVVAAAEGSVAVAAAASVADIAGVAVKPAFVKVAWYEGGAKLPAHRDQVQNHV